MIGAHRIGAHDKIILLANSFNCICILLSPMQALVDLEQGWAEG